MSHKKDVQSVMRQNQDQYALEPVRSEAEPGSASGSVWLEPAHYEAESGSVCARADPL
jgi:hypothetical protein